MSEGFTQEALSRLESAIAQGTLKVSYGDKFVVYRSLQEMLQVRDLMKRNLYPTQSATHNTVMQLDQGYTHEP